MFFDGWQSVERTIILGMLSYLALLVFLRISGKRSLAKMNAFDLIVTVALGSTLASILTSKNISLVQGITGLGLLLFLQWLISWLSVRSSRLENLVKTQPALLYYNGRALEQNLKDERITENELLASLRSQGLLSFSGVKAVVLESNGDISVVIQADNDLCKTLEPVRGWPDKG
jgi:uncharacterized membrane protein YcaP (DUF421 family)